MSNRWKQTVSQSVDSNLGNFKYLRALETAAAKSGKLASLLEAYRGLLSGAPQLHGRIRILQIKQNR